jgi:ribosome-associated translation inhibitor RaiA
MAGDYLRSSRLAPHDGAVIGSTDPGTAMQIQVNTDRHIEGGEELKARVRDVVGRALDRFGERITRVEVHISDVNSGVRGGSDDIRSRMEARLAGLRPLSVTHHAATVDQAVAGAADKLQTTVGRSVDKLQRTKGRTPMGGETG